MCVRRERVEEGRVGTLQGHPFPGTLGRKTHVEGQEPSVLPRLGPSLDLMFPPFLDPPFPHWMPKLLPLLMDNTLSSY